MSNLPTCLSVGIASCCHNYQDLLPLQFSSIVEWANVNLQVYSPPPPPHTHNFGSLITATKFITPLTTISRAPLKCTSCSLYGMFYIGETGRPLSTKYTASTIVLSQVTVKTNLLPDTLTMAVIVFLIWNSIPTSRNNDSRKRHKMRLVSRLGIVHSLGINERFSYI